MSSKGSSVPIVVALCAVAGVGVLLWLMMGAKTQDFRSPQFLEDATPAPVHMVYYPNVWFQVTGQSTKADITMRNHGGDVEQHAGVDVPYKTGFIGKEGEDLYFSAQDVSGRGGVTCSILFDTTVVKKVDSTGPFTIATCSGNVDDLRPAGQ